MFRKVEAVSQNTTKCYSQLGINAKGVRDNVLHVDAYSGHGSIAQLLLEKGEGHSALQISSFSGGMVVRLLEK
jgi:ankyrin repeat protein